jgi:type IV secretory pathway VirB10-like protein
MAQRQPGATTPQNVPECITCGAELHPERARKYNYCMSRECQEKNARGLTMVAVGMNKSAEEFLILDEDTRADLASGKYRDQRRTSFGTSAAAEPRPVQQTPTDAGQAEIGTTPAPAHPAPGPRSAPGQRQAPGRQAPQRRQPQPRPARAPAPPWTPKQQRLALLYNEQGLRPAEIADKLGVSSYLVTQIILAAKNRGKL